MLMVDTSDIATDTDEVGYSINAAFLHAAQPRGCASGFCEESDQGPPAADPESAGSGRAGSIAQKYSSIPSLAARSFPAGAMFRIDPRPDRVAFLTEPRNLSPLISRMRFEAIQNLRLEWDMDYDPQGRPAGRRQHLRRIQLGRYHRRHRATLLNAVDEKGSTASTHPEPAGRALPGDRQTDPRPASTWRPTAGTISSTAPCSMRGVQTVYNWNCCGLTVGYRRFALGALRDETQYLYSFTLANFGSVGDIRRSNTVFHDTTASPPTERALAPQGSAN